MESDNDEDGWINVQKLSEANSNEAANEAQKSLSQNHLRQALKHANEGARWCLLRFFFVAHPRRNDPDSMKTVRGTSPFAVLADALEMLTRHFRSLMNH